jgi:hypothetical protein
MRNCTGDEGGPFEFGIQVLIHLPPGAIEGREWSV